MKKSSYLLSAGRAHWSVRPHDGDSRVAQIEAEKEKNDLLSAIQHNVGVRRLAANPLLLTILAVMKRQGVSLPERRVELYEQYIKTMISVWNKARSMTGRATGRDLDVVQTVRILAPLALWMHEVNPGVGLVRREDLKRQLQAIYAERGETNPVAAAERFLGDIHEHTGLLLERGPEEYGFIHLTFEEYLAGMAIALRGQGRAEKLLELIRPHADEAAWNEVLLLCMGYLGLVQQLDEVAGEVMDGLVQSEEAGAVVLAGEAAADVRNGGLSAGRRQRVQTGLLKVMQGSAPAVLRARAGNVLAELGDPRFRAEAWDLPNEELLGFVRIEAGKFWMGSDPKKDAQADDDEQPQHEVALGTYYMAKYAVTVGQWRAYVQASGHKPENADSLKGTANHPVMWVTWHEALAYCEWLTEKLKAWDETPKELSQVLSAGGRVTLPSEAEWERAARWTDGRIYPWGDEFDANKANTKESGIGRTSAVGCFAGGASVEGLLDMSGNVWEWTRSLWGKDWQKAEFVYPYTDRLEERENLRAGDDVARVLRGGSFDDNGRNARCACRIHSDPATTSTTTTASGSLWPPSRALNSDSLNSDALTLGVTFFARLPPRTRGQAGKILLFLRVLFEFCHQLVKRTKGQGGDGIGAAVVDGDAAGGLVIQRGAGEGHVGHVADAFVVGFAARAGKAPPRAITFQGWSRSSRAAPKL